MVFKLYYATPAQTCSTTKMPNLPTQHLICGIASLLRCPNYRNHSKKSIWLTNLFLQWTSENSKTSLPLCNTVIERSKDLLDGFACFGCNAYLELDSFSCHKVQVKHDLFDTRRLQSSSPIVFQNAPENKQTRKLATLYVLLQLDLLCKLVSQSQPHSPISKQTTFIFQANTISKFVLSSFVVCWPRDISSSLFSLYQKEIVAFRKALLTQRFFRHRNSFCESTGWNHFFHPTLFVSFGSWTWCRCLVIKSGAMVVGATGECNKSEANPLQLMQLPSTRQSTFPRLPRMVSIRPGILDFRLQVEFQGGNKDRLSLRIWDIWENSIHFSVVGKSKHWYGLEGSKWQSK